MVGLCSCPSSVCLSLKESSFFTGCRSSASFFLLRISRKCFSSLSAFLLKRIEKTLRLPNPESLPTEESPRSLLRSPSITLECFGRILRYLISFSIPRDDSFSLRPAKVLPLLRQILLQRIRNVALRNFVLSYQKILVPVSDSSRAASAQFPSRWFRSGISLRSSGSECLFLVYKTAKDRRHNFQSQDLPHSSCPVTRQ